MTNFEHLRTLGIYKMATVILNYCRDTCAYCPRERLRECNDDCHAGLRQWLASEYIPGSLIWKETRHK